ncbi:hypothetical protein [Actinomadura macra]|uniref:hypothetical protein n=1 Tax=Actinomadura macra TaxID=46164 RepID=UPI00082B27D0|nr:hypothetical protein [Actinomadura macra]
MHWHLTRCDQLRAGVAARAGTVLSTNALVIAGVALSLRSQRTDAFLITLAMAALACVVVSVSNAALTLMSVRNWQRQFGEPDTPSAFLYCYSETGETSQTFDGFRQRVTRASADDLLDFALAELWRCGRLHAYRYRRLRVATRWLLAALIFFLATGAASMLH